jgi:hypothetical protein
MSIDIKDRKKRASKRPRKVAGRLRAMRSDESDGVLIGETPLFSLQKKQTEQQYHSK